MSREPRRHAGAREGQVVGGADRPESVEGEMPEQKLLLHQLLNYCCRQSGTTNLSRHWNRLSHSQMNHWTRLTRRLTRRLTLR